MPLKDRSAGQALVDYFLDMIPSLLAGFALFGPSLGLDGSGLGGGGTAFPLQGAGEDAAATSLLLALVGLVFGLSRGRHHGSLRLNLGVACCAFAAAYAGLRFV